MSLHNNNFWHNSYNNHIAEEQKNKSNAKLPTWKQFDTIDYWRHKRMYDNLLPFIETNKQSSWLTVGDGRFGTDANYLIRNGIKNVVATSISDNLLKQAKEEGFISEYRIENAEQMTFDDASFDFVLCKEAYHHFPRPMVALYEMIRVARKAVILIEPNDPNSHPIRTNKILARNVGKWQATKDYIKDLLGKQRYTYRYYNGANYEDVGNYVYTISESEIEKVALGLNFPVIAFKGLNDYYDNGVEFEKADTNNPLFVKVKTEIENQDILCRQGYAKYSLLTAVICKQQPDDELLQKLTNTGYKYFELERNPYI